MELRRASSFGRIRYGGGAAHSQLWRKIGQALSSPPDTPARVPALRIDADIVYLDVSAHRSVRITRIGNSLSTWRVRHQSANTLRLSHPALRNRRDVVFRLEEELAAIFGVQRFSASAITAGVTIRFDESAVSAERLARELEKAWPRILEGLDGPPSQTRLLAAAGLVGLAFTGQYLVPALRPVAVAGVALYSAPNVIDALKQLRRGKVGLYALYTAGLGLMLASGMPFNSAVIAVLMQAWPQLSRRKIIRSQRSLFASARRRPTWARVPQAGSADAHVEVDVDELRAGDLIVVESGDIVSVDGVVTDGHAIVVEDALFGGDQLEDKSEGDTISAGVVVREGRLIIRVERAGSQTFASVMDSLLPHGAITGMPSSFEAERIANRNARPALTLAALTLSATRTLRPAQVLIRPDYATGPRLSAELSVFHSLALGLQRGVLFRKPAALERLYGADIYVIDESAGVERRAIEVAKVQSAGGASEAIIASYALAAHPASRSERGGALAAFAAKHQAVACSADEISRSAGVTRFRDGGGRLIEVASPRYFTAAKLEVPKALQNPGARREGRKLESGISENHPALRSLWVIREGEVLGVVSFSRTGDLAGTQLISTLKAQNEHARIVYLTRASEPEVRTLTHAVGIDSFHADSSQAAKVELIRGLGAKTVWLGDGADPELRESILASTVSMSVAPIARAHEDAADILLPQRGLASVPDVFDLARAHVTRLKQDYRTVYAANLLAAAGALNARFNGLHAGLVSNLGTGVVYARHARNLDKLTRSTEAKRAQLPRPVAG